MQRGERREEPLRAADWGTGGGSLATVDPGCGGGVYSGHPPPSAPDPPPLTLPESSELPGLSQTGAGSVQPPLTRLTLPSPTLVFIVHIFINENIIIVFSKIITIDY